MTADPLKRFRLDGKVAVVTGSSRGLGRQIALELAAVGADVVVASRNQAEIDAVAAQIAQATGRRCVGFAGDIADPAAAEALIARAVDDLGGLHVLVNNAGINVRGAIEQVGPDDYDRVMAINVKAPWLLCRAVAPIFKKQGWGRVINLASALGLVAIADRCLYCTSKGAVVQLTRQLAVEWAQTGITVNAVCPGPFETAMNRVLTQDPQVKEAFASHVAMRRWGQMDEIGSAVIYLASEGASYVTGSMLSVDGGWVAL